MSDAQVLYGLVVDSEVELHQDRPAAARIPADVRVRLGDRVAARLPTPAGSVLASLDDSSGAQYSVVRLDDGRLVMRVHAACDFELSEDLSDVVVRPALGAPAGLASVLTTGAMLALQLYLRGELVLHASAVDVGGAAVAFVGRSGMGKSTMAALMCAGGASLITDDVLRVDGDGEWPVARLGASELRLRKGADQLVGHFERRPGRRVSADQRQVIKPTDAAMDRLPLAAIVVPVPRRDIVELTLAPLSQKQALFALLGFPRLPGWSDPVVIRRQFSACAAMLATVPVYAANVPWGPPFELGVAEELLQALEPSVSAARGVGAGTRTASQPVVLDA